MASISEQFGPLAGIDMTWKNSLITKVEIRRNRDLSLSMQNSQLTEVSGRELTIGSGYIINNESCRLNELNKKIKSDLNVRCDVSVRTNKTVVRKIPIEGRTQFDPILRQANATSRLNLQPIT